MPLTPPSISKTYITLQVIFQNAAYSWLEEKAVCASLYIYMMRLQILMFGAFCFRGMLLKKTLCLHVKVNKPEVKADFKEMQSPKLYGLASQKAYPTYR